MADLQITQLPELASANLQATDPIAVADVSATETKKITKEATKYFIFTPASQITTIPLKAIRIEVPRSGCETTRNIGIIKMLIGIARFMKLLTLCICTL